MATITGFERLDAWQKARELAKEIYAASSDGAFAKDFVLRDQIRRAAVSVISNIAEGFERGGNAEFVQFLSIAKGSVGEVRAQVYIALDQGYIDRSRFEQLQMLADGVSKKLGGLIAYLKKSGLEGAKYKDSKLGTRNPKPESRRAGFSLVTAIFLLVILASLSAFIVTVSGVQQTSSALDVQGARAYQAARSGIEWASYQLNANYSNDCAAGYLYGRTVTIDHTKVPNTVQSNFPMLFSGTYLYLKTVANGGNVTNASGFDIIFSQGATKLDHEIESYDAATGAVNFWVRVPTVSPTTDTVISLCYGNAAITTSQENKTGVWDTNFKGVWHLKEDPSGAAPQMKDSTSNAQHGTSGGAMTSADQVPGKIAGSLDFDGIGDYVGGLANVTSQYTISVWFYSHGPQDTYDTWESAGSFWSWEEAGGTNPQDFRFYLPIDDKVTAKWDTIQQNDTRVKTSIISHNQWVHAVAVQEANTFRIYLNGVENVNSAISAHLSGTQAGVMGKTFVGTYHDTETYWGLIDEARVSDVPRSADWVKTEYNNQSSPSTFYTLGSENNAGVLASACNATACTTPPACTIPPAACTGSCTPLTSMGGTLFGFTTNVDCCSSSHNEGGVTVQVYQICSTAAQGTVGTIDRVERQLQATVSR